MPSFSVPAALTNVVRRQPASPRSSAELGRRESPSLRPRLSMDKDSRRMSLVLLGGRSPSSLSLKEQPAHIECKIESPPLVMHGDPNESTGALLSGRLNLIVNSGVDLTISSFTLTLVAETDFKKPVTPHCNACEQNKQELKTWTMVDQPLSVTGGEHVYPFSHLLSGNLPPTTKTALCHIQYYLLAKCLSVTGEEFALTTPIKVSRALFPRPDKTSIRVFPPTKLSATVVLPSVMYQVGNTPVQLLLSGIVNPEKKTRWRLRKMQWRIDERVKCVSPACETHSKKLGGEGKGMMHEDVRTVGSFEMKNGWKTDFDFQDTAVVAADGTQQATVGRVEAEFNIAPKLNQMASNSMSSPCGMSVSHVLTIELVVLEESIPTNRIGRVHPQTGSARVLRMQFNVNFTDRPGLGISWDEEQPPLYEDVPESPPLYKTEIVDCISEDLSLDDVPEYAEGEMRDVALRLSSEDEDRGEGSSTREVSSAAVSVSSL